MYIRQLELVQSPINRLRDARSLVAPAMETERAFDAKIELASQLVGQAMAALTEATKL
jgi:hypothetical protein